MGTKSSTKATTRKASKASTKSEGAEPAPSTDRRPANPLRRAVAALVVAEALGWDPSDATTDARPWAAQFARPAIPSTADDFAEILVSLAGPCAETTFEVDASKAVEWMDLEPTDPDVLHAWAVLGPRDDEPTRTAFEMATRNLLAKVNPAIDAWERIHLNGGGTTSAAEIDVRARFLNPRALPELRDVDGAKWSGPRDNGSTPRRLPGRDSPRARYVAEDRPASGATTKATSRTSTRAA